MNKVDVVEILKKSDALLEGHFLLSSGKHSNRYVQCAKVLRFPQYAEAVLSTVVEQIKDLDIDLVVGPAMGGAPGVGDGHGSPASCRPRGPKESDTTAAS